MLVTWLMLPGALYFNKEVKMTYIGQTSKVTELPELIDEGLAYSETYDTIIIHEVKCPHNSHNPYYNVYAGKPPEGFLRNA